jgi:hypothetical protein
MDITAFGVTVKVLTPWFVITPPPPPPPLAPPPPPPTTRYVTEVILLGTVHSHVPTVLKDATEYKPSVVMTGTHAAADATSGITATVIARTNSATRDLAALLNLRTLCMVITIAGRFPSQVNNRLLYREYFTTTANLVWKKETKANSQCDWNSNQNSREC